MLPAISQVCSLNSPFDKDVEDYAAGHCRAIDVWLTKLENYLAQHSIDDVRRLLEQNQMTAPVASYQGGLLASQGDARREAWNLFDQRLEMCRAVGITTLVVAADVPQPLDQLSIDRVYVSLQQAAQRAADFQVRVALEFQASSAYINNLQTAAALVHEVQNPALGLCLDVFHLYVGPSKLEDLGYLSRENLFHVQLSDLAAVPREFASDSDRIVPGDGDLPIAPLIDHLQRIGYDGCVSMELMNPQLWQVPARQVGEIGMTALRKILGQASM